MKKLLAGTILLLVTVSVVSAGNNGWYLPGDESAGGDNTSLPLRKEIVLEPTHFMVVPTSQVLDAKQYVVSFHELSYGIDKNIQLTLCPWDDEQAGRLLLGIKYGLRNDLALGAGFIYKNNMLGLYVVKSFLHYGRTISYGLVDCQIGSQFTGEGGIGTEVLLTDNVKLMGEALLGNSGEEYGNSKGDLDLNIALRYMWPVNRPLKIDFGMKLKDLISNISAGFDDSGSASNFQFIYVDVSYSSKMR